MKRNISFLTLLLPFLAGILFAGACQKQPDVKTIFTAEYKESELPEIIPAEGGKYSVTFVFKDTKSMELNATVLPWKCRLTVDGAYTNPVDGTPGNGVVEVEVPENKTSRELPVTLELSVDFGPWNKVYECKQAASLFDYSESLPKIEGVIPERISCNGATYRVAVEPTTVTKAGDPTFLPWRYRIVSDAAGAPVGPFQAEDTEVDIIFPANYSATPQTLTLEVSYDDLTSLWKPVATFKQDAGFIQEAGILWARGNVALSADKTRFIIADDAETVGLLFRPGSIYGIPAGEAYAGKAYKPEETAVAIASIPEPDFAEDPCAKVDPAFRMPTYAELLALSDNIYRKISRNDVPGWAFSTSSLFFPFAGIVDEGTGAFTGDGMSYLGNGSDLSGNTLKFFDLVIDDGNGPVEYFDVAETPDASFGSVRCVYNTALPTYVSHEADEVTAESFDLEITTNPGDFEEYEVSIVKEGSDPVGTVLVTAADPVAVITVPDNLGPASLEDITWNIFVNHVNTGVSFVQPAEKDYVYYIGYEVTPGSVLVDDDTLSADSFILKVLCISDKASFPVEISFSDNTATLTGTGSAEASSIAFEIPANSGAARTLTISVNGVEEETLTQEGV